MPIIDERAIRYRCNLHATLTLPNRNPNFGDAFTPNGMTVYSHSSVLTRETARYLALWMSYEDTVRVADLKTRRYALRAD